MSKILIKQAGEDISTLKPAITLGVTVDNDTVPGGIVVTDGEGSIVNSGKSTDNLAEKEWVKEYVEEQMSNTGSGDMLKSIYDTDGDGIVDDSAKLGGVAASEYALKTDIPEIDASDIVDSTFVGTTEQLNALSQEEQENIEVFFCTDEDYTDSDGNMLATVAQVGVMIANASTIYTEVETTLVAANWVDNIYTLTVTGITSKSDQEVLPALDITTEQLEALQSANLQDGGQSIDTMIIKAFGDVPTIDIPIRVIIRNEAEYSIDIVKDAETLGGKSADSYYNLGFTDKTLAEYVSLNNVTDEGDYYVNSSVASTLTDVPEELLGVSGLFNLTVKKISINRILQIIIKHNNIVYWRTGQVGGTFFNWERVAYTDNISNPALNINPDFRINQRNGYYIPSGSMAYTSSDLSTEYAEISASYNVTVVNSTYSTFVVNGITRYVKTSDCKKGYVGTANGLDGYIIGSGLIVEVNEDNTLTLINDRDNAVNFYQRIENCDRLFGETLTLSVKDIDNNSYSCTGILENSYPSSDKTICSVTNDKFKSFISMYTDGRLQIFVTVQPKTRVTLKYFKLELGSVATPLSPPKPSEALSECQRYLYKSSENKPIIGYPIKYNANQIWFSVPIPTSMKNGTTTFLGTLNSDYGVYKTTGEKVNFTSIGAYQHAPNSLIVLANLTSHGLTTNCYLQFGENSGISCEL